MLINEITEGTRCWKGYKKKGMKTMFGKRVPNCVKNEGRGSKALMPGGKLIVGKGEVAFHDDYGWMARGWMDDDFSYFDSEREARDFVEKTYKLRKEIRNKVANDDSESEWERRARHFKNEPRQSPWMTDDEEDAKFDVEENLRAWFGKGKKGGAGGGGWDRYNSKGERVGKCGDGKGKGKPKCLSKSAAAKLRNADKNKDGKKDGKSAIANAVKRKQKNDPNKNRRGKAKNVKN